ncbi:N-acetyltransferase [Haemophilus haemolyticus]|uniref:N-acetyltransferase n=1 Tax=Haemophilus haemolyticus TaxID=726 RepID=UPI000E57248B|nr:N-acetyltransferase [Haemophilus haemolyticus]
MDNLKIERFSDVDLNDPFFDSLKTDYKEFSNWFMRKADEKECAYVLYNQHSIDGFLYLKEENEIPDIEQPIYNRRILKVGTFKFNPQGTLRGQRFIKKILDIAIVNDFELIYLTIFEKYDYLIKLFQEYGFYHAGTKQTMNGTECVYMRDMRHVVGDIILDYPYVDPNANKYLLAIHPEYHTRLFPDSILCNEYQDIVQDVSHSNSIHKIYISAADDACKLKHGDILIIYRTSDRQGHAYYRSVVSSICVVEEVRHISKFPTEESYLKYCSRFSVFTNTELSKFYKEKRYPYVIRFTYNIALPKRVTRKELLDNGIIRDQNRIVLHPISDDNFSEILFLSKANESFIID